MWCSLNVMWWGCAFNFKHMLLTGLGQKSWLFSLHTLNSMVSHLTGIFLLLEIWCRFEKFALKSYLRHRGKSPFSLTWNFLKGSKRNVDSMIECIDIIYKNRNNIIEYQLPRNFYHPYLIYNPNINPFHNLII